jgi:hypothetical protein
MNPVPLQIPFLSYNTIILWISDSLIMTYTYIYFKIWQIDYTTPTSPKVTILAQTTLEGLPLVLDFFELVTDHNNYVYAVFRNINNMV